MQQTRTIILFLIVCCIACRAKAQKPPEPLLLSAYQDRVKAVWAAQILGAMLGWPFEHKAASVSWIDHLSDTITHAPVDDDWYYEMVALRAFEQYGIDMSVQQLGKQWLQNAAGSWGSSEQARLLMLRGIMPPDCGHPRYNKLWHTIGPQFSSELYGMLAPGLPNVAGSLARKYTHINGYAEGADGGVFVAGLVSLGFTEKDTRTIVRKAAQLIHPASPYRQCLDMVIRLAAAGKSAPEVFSAIEKRWRIEYPASNNAVANGGIVAACVWFGNGSFLKTVNLAFQAADFTDADCNAASAGAVVAAMHGMSALPAGMVRQLGDRIIGRQLGGVILTPAVNESIAQLAARTTAIGLQLLKNKGMVIAGSRIKLIAEPVHTQPAELFRLEALTRFWNPEWKLRNPGFGGAGGGMPGLRGITYLEDSVLATYPRDEVKGVLLTRTITLNGQKELRLSVGVDSMRAWRCMVFINNYKKFDQLMEGPASGRGWKTIKIDLTEFAHQQVTIRIYQRVLIPGKVSGNAYWKDLVIQ
ncbi:hypothetical protein A8C56_20705 [Niabella ginsenosidivorans]|uniref:ADP-ribosylglycohydrolase n=1 Tax=Niabella ginsenosidivorans TaxID=1176587 RepID=A0A1A9I7Q4_9BACT|nr:ADP-ribosylglycohydrolase family protein [Niabella ginsenosidivorans]ANH83079.1 hypothetical protein A8C56_20705 [Niabella ginsenosidivorans]